MTATPAPFACAPAELLRHDQWLRRLAARLVHGADVEDLVQDTWTAVCTVRGSPGTLRSWLATVARRLAARSHRTATRRLVRERRAAAPEQLPSTDATVALIELQRCVAAAVAAMAEPYRATVLLRYYHGLDTAAIADRCACSEAAVRKRLERGIDELRARLRRAYGPGWRHAAPVVLLAGRPDVAGAAAATAAGALLVMSKQKVGAAAALLVAAGLFGWWATAAPGEGAPGGPGAREPGPGVAVAAQGPAAEATPTAAPDRVAIAPGGATGSDTAAAKVCRGRVLDPAGRPLPSVALVLASQLPELLLHTDPAAAAAFDPGALPVAGTSDAEGCFAIVAAGRSYLLAGAGWATLRTPVVTAGGGDGLVVVAAEAVAVRGHVVDAAGQPLANVRVDVQVPALVDFSAVLDSTRDNPLAPAKSAPDGAFAVGHLARGIGEIAFHLGGYVSANIPVPQESRANERIVLAAVGDQAMVVHGRVLDMAGLAIPGARVGLHGRMARAGWDGSFQLVFHRPEDVPRPSSRLFAAHPGYQTLVLADFGARLVDPAQREVELRLPGPALAIAGRVVDATGAPRRGALVYLWNEPNVAGNQTAEELAMDDGAPLLDIGPGIRVHARTDEHGAFELTGLRDQAYRLRVLLDSPRAAITSGPVAAGSRGIEVCLPAELTWARRLGRVVTEAGVPVAGVRLQEHLAMYRNSGSTWSDDRAVVVSDADGRFELRDVPQQDASLTYTGDDIVPGHAVFDARDPAGVQTIVVLRRCHFRVQVDPRHGAERFQVLDATGEVVNILEIGTDGWSSSTDRSLEQGRSGVLSVSEKGVTLVLSGAGRELARLPLQLRPGEVTVVRY